jgi:hypothetical protein
MKKQIRVIIELILGLGLGVPSMEDIFAGIFRQMWIDGNYMAIIGYITAVLVGLILFLDSIAVVCGFKNLGDLFEALEVEE